MYRVDGALRGVIVPPGTHRVTFEYRPRHFLTGLVTSGVAMFACLLLIAAPASLLRRQRYQGEGATGLPGGGKREAQKAMR